MKTTTLNIRIPSELKIKLENQAKLNNQSFSDFIRDLLESNLQEMEHNFIDVHESFNTVKYNSYDFIIIITWIFEKRFNHFDQNTENTFNNLKDIIFKIVRDDSYPESLKRELEKVIFDIIRYNGDKGNQNRYFHFGIPNHAMSFNYSVLTEFIYIKGFSIEEI